MKITEKKITDYVQITLENETGMYICLTELGAGIREIRVPDRDGESKIVTLCPFDEEVFRNGYWGKTIGRTSGRIANAVFSIGDKTATLEKNNHWQDNLHGGSEGLHAKVFSHKVIKCVDYTDVIFVYKSPDGEGGYFGNADVKVTYRIFEKENTFRIIFSGETDSEALLNLTNHVYFNMSGNLCQSVKEQTLFINASRVGRLNERLIIEEIVSVAPEFDFRTAHKIGDCIYNENVQRHTFGYDHPYFLDNPKIDKLAASFESAHSGIRLEVRTTYPCVVFYADSCPASGMKVLPDKEDEQYFAACLECQYNPDGIHSSPDNCGILTAEKPYHEETEYKFSVK